MEALEVALPYLVRYSYLGVFGLILLFSTALPFSKTLVIVAAGVLASRGVGSLSSYLLASVAGLVTADSIYFTLGYIVGEKALTWRFFSGDRNRERFLAAEERFKKHEWLAVFTARFLPYLRAPIFVVAGLSRMSPLRFLSADLPSACLLAPVAITLGYAFGESSEALVRLIKQGETALALLLLIVLVLVFVLPRRSKRH